MTEPEQTDSQRDDAALDELRIRQHALLRRSLYRARSYAVIAAVACTAGAAQCALLALRYVRASGWDLRAWLFLALMIAGIMAAIFFVRRALALNREAQRSAQPEPTTPPDFSTLSDGSQRARNLEDVQ